MTALAYPALAARAPRAPRSRPRRARALRSRRRHVEIRAEASSSSSSSALDVLQGARIVAPNGGGDGEVRDSVVKYYGETLTTSDDLKTSARCTPNALPSRVRDILSKVPDEVKAKYYGCGSPTLGIDGLRVLDLGSGSGRDCCVAASSSARRARDGRRDGSRRRPQEPSRYCVGARLRRAQRAFPQGRDREPPRRRRRDRPSTSSSPTAW